MQVGDTLLARNAETGKTEARIVKARSKVKSSVLITIEIADPKTGQVLDSITGTPNHPFFIGTSLVTRAGPKGLSSCSGKSALLGSVVVKSIHREELTQGREVSVYNFEVEGTHTSLEADKVGYSFIMDQGYAHQKYLIPVAV